MAILGSNSAGPNFASMDSGGMLASKYTLASAGTLNELHGWFDAASSSMSLRIVIYKDVAGTASPVPGATLIGYTSPLTLTGGSAVHLQETGFSVAMPAGDYWIGARTGTVGSQRYVCNASGGGAGRSASVPDPPPDPFGTGTTTSTTRQLCCWAVVGAAAVAPTADFTGTPLSGVASLSVAFTDTSANTPTSWAWTFGDGGTSSSQNPTHAYTVAGTYTVVLVATNGSGSDTKTRTAYVTVTENIVYVAGGGIEII